MNAMGKNDQSQPFKEKTFQYPFSIMVTGPSGSGKTEWTRKCLLSSLVHPPPDQILWCFGQWQPLFEDLHKRIPRIEFVQGMPDYLYSPQFINPGKRNLIIFEPRLEISYNAVCATSKGSDQPAHTRSLITAFACRLIILWLSSY